MCLSNIVIVISVPAPDFDNAEQNGLVSSLHKAMYVSSSRRREREKKD